MTVELPPTIKHATHRAYSVYKCRCEACKAAHAEQCKVQYQSRLQRMKDGTANVEHGTVSTYSGWGCRCEPCTEASARYNADMRAGIPIGQRRTTVTDERDAPTRRPRLYAVARPITT